MSRLLKIALIFLGLSVLCKLGYDLIGSSIDGQGLLHEPFALIPLGWLFFALACVSALLAFIRWLRRKKS
ncbi:DUF3955 domain-containing protein [Craterilacuibacter sp. RT1T]|uniref:DUF3955 domain-containing protein n=1 Tax=Craterilacuibacter sp. RT1T TaxID=2942211 RepID=UPI0020C0528D|nr:DUF3955 domain-containing protein [Craterilacuibacter sp. RT1T]MCL6263269.1 DUF3955 domain-containing protein [Craterilacuibacter sp. RT1T]